MRISFVVPNDVSIHIIHFQMISPWHHSYNPWKYNPLEIDSASSCNPRQHIYLSGTSIFVLRWISGLLLYPKQSFQLIWKSLSLFFMWFKNRRLCNPLDSTSTPKLGHIYLYTDLVTIRLLRTKVDFSWNYQINPREPKHGWHRKMVVTQKISHIIKI